MKRIVCEMCGSNDLLKKDGVFECQSCGTKYSVEEAKKMMIDGVVDVSGSTVKIDNSKNIDNFLKNAKTLYQDNKFDEAYSLFGEVLNIDAENYIAIAYRGLCSAWKTTIKNPLILDAVNGLTRSLELAKKALGESKEYANFSIEISNEIYKICWACLGTFINYIEEACNTTNAIADELKRAVDKAGLYADFDFYRRQGEEAYSEFNRKVKLGNHGITFTLQAIMVVTAVIFKVDDINTYTVEQYKIIKENLDKCISTVSGSVTDMNQEDYKNVVGCSAVCDIRIKEIIQKKKDEYWEQHQEEKKKLEDEILEYKNEIKTKVQSVTELKEKKREIKKQMNDTVPSEKELQKFNEKKQSLQNEKSSLSLFKSKEKRALQEQINNVDEQIEKINKKVESERKELEKQYQPDIAKIDTQIENIEKEIEILKNKILENEKELDKEIEE